MESTEVLRCPRCCYGIVIHPVQAHSSTQSALLAHSADYCCYLSSRCENLGLGLDCPSPALVLVHYFQGGITGHAHAVTGEDALAMVPGDVVDRNEALDSDCIDRKME